MLNCGQFHCRNSRRVAGDLVFVALPLMGGCPEFRNYLINLGNASTRSLVLEDPDQGRSVENRRP